MDAIIQIIGSLGFPIAAAIAMFWLLKKETDAHKDESDKWVKALDNNTQVVEKLVEVIEKRIKIED